MGRLLLLLLVLASACAPSQAPAGTPTSPTIAQRTLTIYAASSLQTALEQTLPIFERANAGVIVVVSYGGSPTLRSQLENGARADVFLPADMQQMNLARQAGAVQGEPVVYAVRKLAVIAPADRARVAALEDLAGPGVRLVLAQKEVPVGVYAQQALDTMNASAEFGPDFADRVLANLVSEESNVGQVIAKVSLGEADAAIIYTLSQAEVRTHGVRLIPIPDRYNVLARYPAAVAARAAQPGLAQAFIAFLQGPGVQDIFAKNGFGA